MNSVELVGNCGLYCGACTIYRAERDDQGWRGKLAEKFNCTIEQVSCNGCGALTANCWGNGCKIVKCARAKGYNYCYECEEYKDNSCEKFANLYNRYLENSSIDLRNNLVMIQEGKIDELLARSSERFKCKYCLKPTVAGAKTCHHCNREL